MNIIETKVVRSISTKQIVLDEKSLREHLAYMNIPDNASIYVNVPGGGDWSNTQLDISDNPIIITWTEVIEDE